MADSSFSSPTANLFHVWLPVIGSLSGLVTIVIVYVLTWQGGHLPPQVTTPPISLLRCQEPEHTAYQIGFSVTGLVLANVIYNWTHVFFSPIARSFGIYTAWIMRGGAYVAVLGLVGQGVVTLQEDLLEQLQKQGGKFSKQSVYHQLLAAIFFLGAAVHCYTTVYYALSSSSSSGSCCCYGTWSIRIKCLCVCTSLLSWPLGEMLHPTRHANQDDWNIGGLAQYIAVGSYIAFFGSYALDFVNRDMITTAVNNAKDRKEKSL